MNAVKENLGRFQAALPDDVKISYQFDESPIVYRAIESVGVEGALGAGLTGLMVLLFLRDLRAVIVVVLNIPLALLGSIVVLNLTGNTINIMTLGGLALAIGILVDEATVEIENIHTQMEHTASMSRAVRQGNMETAVPRLLALFCILSVFIPSFIMQGAVRALFVPLSLAVGGAMVTSYLLSSTFVPVLCVWLLENRHDPHAAAGPPGFFERMQNRYEASGFMDGCARAHRGARLPARDRCRGGLGRRKAWPRAFPEGRHGPVPAPRAAAAGNALRAHHARLRRRPSMSSPKRWGPTKSTSRWATPAANPPQFTINMAYLWSRGPGRQPAAGRLARRKQGRHIRASRAVAKVPPGEGGRLVPRGAPPHGSHAPNRPTSASPTWCSPSSRAI